jgi:hypothetical protein
METCENCGNQYDKAFKVLMNNKEHVFDSFECAINALAPRCDNCHSRIIGHGVEIHNRLFCCAHCAKAANENGVVDRIS